MYESCLIIILYIIFQKRKSCREGKQCRPEIGRQVKVVNSKMIDKNSSIPMYQQIVDTLRSEILRGKYHASGNLGTHKELAERFGVSMITIRKAMQLLAEEGLVDIKQGKGTFVRDSVPQDSLRSLTGIQNVLSSQNIPARQQVKTFEVIPVPKRFDESIREAMGDCCLHIERVHTVEEKPVAYADIYLPIAFGEQITRSDVENANIYQIYKNKLKVELGKGRQKILAAAAGKRSAEKLQVSPKSPVLEVQRCAYSKDGRLIEYMEMFYEPHHYTFEVELYLSAE